MINPNKNGDIISYERWYICLKYITKSQLKSDQNRQEKVKMKIRNFIINYKTYKNIYISENFTTCKNFKKKDFGNSLFTFKILYLLIFQYFIKHLLSNTLQDFKSPWWITNTPLFEKTDLGAVAWFTTINIP